MSLGPAAMKHEEPPAHCPSLFHHGVRASQDRHADIAELKLANSVVRRGVRSVMVFEACESAQQQLKFGCSDFTNKACTEDKRGAHAAAEAAEGPDQMPRPRTVAQCS